MLRSITTVVLASALMAAPASAGPSNADLEEMFSIFGLQLRGFAGASSNFRNASGGGGDVDLVLGGSQYELLVGGRFGSDGAKTELAAADIGFRTLIDSFGHRGTYLQGGVLVGSQLADGFGLPTGELTALSGEAGIEWPRMAKHRFVASARVDVGHVSHDAASRIVPDPAFAMASLNLGFVVGAR
jgi:hypothetical protein